MPRKLTENMPYVEKDIEKVHWTIGEVAKIFKIKTSNLRFWEDEFGKLHTKRDRDDNRIYTKKDIYKIYRIWSYLHEWGFTIPGAKRQLKIK